MSLLVETRNSMAKNPQKAASYYRKGLDAIKLESYAVARTMFEKALELDKGNPDILLKLGQVLITAGFREEAVEVLQRCVKRRPNHPDTLLVLSQAYMGLDQIENMHRTLDKALSWDPTHGVCLHAKVAAHINSGELELAREVLDRAEHIDDPHPLIWMSRGKLARATKNYGEGIDAINALLDHPRALERHKRSGRFELGHLYDAMGEYDKAFESFKLANGGHIAGKGLHAESMIGMWSKDMLASLPRSTVNSERCVFVFGMPRSGTTLTEQILAAHPLVDTVGECPLISQQLNRKTPTNLNQTDVDRYAQEYHDLLDERTESSCTRVIDKHIGGERTLGLISRMLPGSKVIHCLRDPIDSCLSAYFQNFGPNVNYSRDLVMLGQYYKAHRQLMDHWHDVLDLEILQSSYEALVAEPDARARELVAHIGLDFDERCLRFHESKSHVGTASSVQVRRPIYQSSKQRWKHYEKHLGPLLDELGAYAQLDSGT
jgi:Sulfotransferase family/Tetratricopeptide repeat